MEVKGLSLYLFISLITQAIKVLYNQNFKIH